MAHRTTCTEPRYRSFASSRSYLYNNIYLTTTTFATQHVLHELTAQNDIERASKRSRTMKTIAVLSALFALASAQDTPLMGSECVSTGPACRECCQTKLEAGTLASDASCRSAQVRLLLALLTELG